MTDKANATTKRSARPTKAAGRGVRKAPTARAAKRVVREEGVRAKLRYRFDLALSRGPSVVILWLGLLTLLLIVATAIVLRVFRLAGVGGGEELGLFEAVWQAMLRVVDAGSFAGDTGWATRLVALAITIAGIFIAGSLIGLIANAVDQRIEELRKGRSKVLETDHTLILGWSSRVPSIVSELVIANESIARTAVVVLAPSDKTEMEDDLRDAVPDSRTTRIVCRSGAPWDMKNLDLVNLHGARSVIIVGESTDAATIKTLLAIRAARGQLAANEPRAPVIAELVDAETATSVKALFGDELVTVSSDAIVAELTAQSCRQRGLSSVFRELLDFEGDEIYMAPFPELAGSTYAAVQMAFEHCAVLGVLGADGSVVLNPPADHVLADGDQVIAVTEDESKFLIERPSATGTPLAGETTTAVSDSRRVVIVGWSGLGPRVIAELDEFLDERTTIELLLDPDLVDVDAIRNGVSAANVVLEVSELGGGPEHVAAHAARRAFNEVIVLGYRNVLTVDDADARTLLTLLAFNQVRTAPGVGPVRIVAEMLDQSNSPLAEATGVDDFVVSDQLTSLMLAQLSERPELHQLFSDLFDSDGCTIELGPAPRYGAQQARTFADIVVTASKMGHSAIGYRVGATSEVVINPAKSAAGSWSDGDEILVIAGRSN